MADDQIIVQIQLDDGSIKEGLINIENNVKKTGESINKDLTGSFITAELAVKGIEKAFQLVEDLFKEGVGAAAAYEKSVNKLSFALASSGKFSEIALAQFEDFSKELSRATGTNEEAILSNAATLSSVGKLSGDALEKATKAAINLSVATDKDLNGATFALAKLATGATDSLVRYGIKIDESVPKSQRFAVALEQINKRFGALGEANLNTFEGATAKVSNAFEEVLKAFGNLLVKSPSVRVVIKAIADVLETIADKLNKLFQGQDPFKNIIASALSFGVAVAKLLVPVELFFNFFKIGALAVGTFFAGFAFGILKVEQLFTENIVFPFITFFTDKLAKVIGFFSKDTEEKLRSVGSSYLEGLKSAQDKGIELTEGLFKTGIEATVDSTSKALDTSISDGAINYLTKLQDLNAKSDELKKEIVNIPPVELGTDAFGAFEIAANSAKDAMVNFATTAKTGFAQAGAAAITGIGRGVGSAFAAFGAALAKGENAAAAFAKAFIASIGQAAIALGSEFILRGIAYLFVPQLAPLGPGLIAAGAALATFGGVLSAVGGGGGGVPSASGAGGGGGSADLGAGQQTLGAPTTAQNTTPQTQNQLIVQGSIFDSNDTGTRLVDLLRNYGNNNGQATLT